MKNILKRLVGFCLTFALVIPCVAFLTACKESPSVEKRVVAVSLNPSVEFVLGSDGKVVAVDSRNDEGNFVLSLDGVSFIGNNIYEAITKFVDIAKEYGFIDKEDANRLTLEISGSDARKVYDKIKGSLNQHLKNIKASYVNISFDAITKSELEDLVKECRLDFASSVIEEKTEEELIEIIEDSRKATAGIYSEEMKMIYYMQRGENSLIAKYTYCQAKIDYLDKDPGFNPIFAGENDLHDWTQYEGIDVYERINRVFTSYYNEYMNSLNGFYDSMIQDCLSEGGEYYEALNSYISAKKSLLKARVNNESEQVKGELQNAVNSAAVVLYGEDMQDDGVGGLKEQFFAERQAFLESMTEKNNIMELGIQTLIAVVHVELMNMSIADSNVAFHGNFIVKYHDEISKCTFWEKLNPKVN